MSALDTVSADYLTLTTGCGLLDRSERGKLALTGAETKAFLHGQVSQDITALTPGHGVYAALLTNKGKMLGDLRVLDTGAELLLDTERVALQELFNTVRRFSIGFDVALHKRTLESGLLSLIGPRSDAVVAAAIGGGALPGPDEHDHLSATVATAAATPATTASAAATPATTASAAVRLVRTNVGLDLLCDAADRDRVHAALVGAGAVPVSEAAAEIVRIESGRPRYGIDLDDSVIPQEAGLNDRAVSFTKGCYVGQETVARLFYKGKPTRELRGLRSAAPLAPGTELSYAGRVVATVTSAADSPRLGPVALALVRREAEPGARLESGEGESAEVVALPFDRG
jgi:folate-binding protein YgfZ